METMDKQLKHCPFCGFDGELEVIENGSFYSVECPECFATGGKSSYRYIAIAAWENRHGKGNAYNVSEKLPNKVGNYLVITEQNEWEWSPFDGKDFTCRAVWWIELPDPTSIIE